MPSQDYEANNFQPCAECDELKAHEWHHDMPDVGAVGMIGNTIPDNPHFDSCGVEGDWQDEWRGYITLAKCHELEPGGYCADSGRCEVCVDQAVDYADHLRDAAKEA